MKLNRRPFTLIELLTAMAIIVVLAGTLMAVAPVVQKKIKVSRCKGQIKALEVAFEQYKTDWGYYPQMSPAASMSDKFINGDGTNSGIANPSNGKSYIDLTATGLSLPGATLLDPWGNPFYYESPGTMNVQQYDLWSMGPDGKMGNNNGLDPANAQTTAADNSDDIASWKRLY